MTNDTILQSDLTSTYHLNDHRCIDLAIVLFLFLLSISIALTLHFDLLLCICQLFCICYQSDRSIDRTSNLAKRLQFNRYAIKIYSKSNFHRPMNEQKEMNLHEYKINYYRWMCYICVRCIHGCVYHPGVYHIYLNLMTMWAGKKT